MNALEQAESRAAAMHAETLTQVARLGAGIDRVLAERDTLRLECDRLRAENDALRLENAALRLRTGVGRG